MPRLSKFCFSLFVLLSIGAQSRLFSQNISRFSLLKSKQTGIDFVNEVNDSNYASILKYANFYGGAGVGLGDFNNDGLLDIYFAGNMSADRLYINQGNLQFSDVTESAGILDDGGWSTGVTLADVNQDGNLDIYVSRELYDERPDLRRNLLYVNNGDGSFSEKGKEYGIANQGRTRHSVFFDYNKDGMLDLLLLTQPPNPGSLSPLTGSELIKDEFSLVLYKNLGTTFQDVTKDVGLFRTGFPNAVSASDLNNDGWTDLYIANDFYVPDFMFINNQDGTFTNVTDKSLKHMSYYSMGVDVADINNDNELDVFVLDMVAEDNFRLKSNMSGMNRQSFWDVHEKWGNFQYMYNSLHLNNGNGTFSDVAQFANMAATDWSWANLVADFDNDGLKDVYITNGLFRDIRNTDADKKVAEYVNKSRFEWLKKHPDGGGISSAFDIIDLEYALKLIPSQALKNYAYKNKGDLEFEKVSNQWGLDAESFSNGAAYGDLDNDGDLDIVVNNLNDKAFVYRNNTEQFQEGNYIRFKLSDAKNRGLFGTRITIVNGKHTQTIETTNVRGIYSTSEPLVHFGIGKDKKVDSATIKWPDGKQTTLVDIEGNRQIEVNWAEADFYQKAMSTTSVIFSELQNTLSALKHLENEFDDFDVQVLLPHKMSQFGPALAVADVNNDGLDDLFFGGAVNQEGRLFIQNTNGQFEQSNQELFKKESPYEDVDAIFFDIDGDNDQDLYVVSGGNEFPSSDFHYVDRIYLNDGGGGFTKGALLNANRESGSKTAVADYDGDGDLDVFVGGRHKPHDYPAPATSALLINENGQLHDKTNVLAGGFLNLGMVTDAKWVDYDSDNDIDLLIVGEWMPLTIFANENGFLKKKVIPAFESTKGWWFSIESADFDNDGDIDFIAGNLGLNYKYKTSIDSPFDIYYDDFDQNGNRDIVLGYYNNDKHFPLRGFSCSSEQIPGLKKEIQKYDIFASMEIDEVYGQSNLKGALHYETDTFASVYIENLGNGNFNVVNLPNTAQLSNINDFLIDDFNADGFLDALSVGNLYVSEIETPRNDAGTGVLLLGNGKGNFKPVSIEESGFFASGDAKKIQLLNQNRTKLIVVANNNGPLQLFEMGTEKTNSSK